LGKRIEAAYDLIGGKIVPATSVLGERASLVAAGIVAEHPQRNAVAAQRGNRAACGRDRRIAEIEHAPGVEQHEVE
jgi:hypothetical protein